VATKIGQLAEELSATNPWWCSGSWSALDQDVRAAQSLNLNYQSRVLDGIEPGGLYLLRGPRRVGKTVAVK
jgi:uncharacterized protein